MPTLALEVWPLEAPLEASVPVVADAEILERTLLLAALGSGESRLKLAHAPHGLGECLQALGTLGFTVTRTDNELSVVGRGLRGFEPPSAPLDTPAAPIFWLGLLASLSSQDFSCTLAQHDPDEVESALELLRARGANVSVVDGGIQIAKPAAALTGGGFALTPAQASLKHLLLVSGLFADQPTTVREAVVSADHSERALLALGCNLTSFGPVVRLEPVGSDRAFDAFEARIPGSPSAAAYLQALAAATPGSHVVVRDVSLNPTRSSFTESLRRYGATVGLSPRWEALGEPAGELSVQANRTSPLNVGGELALRLDHEFYALVFLAARASGTSHFSGLPPSLTARDVTRIVAYLKSFGLEAEASEHGFSVEGKGERPLRATRVTTGGDPRLAVLGSMLALSADAKSVIDDVENLSVLFPKLVGTLRALGARLEVTHD